MRATGDSLNLDVLELVCSLVPWNSLASVALVSKSFHAAAISRLYSSLFFGLNHAKRYPGQKTSFASVVAQPSLAIYIRHIDIRAVPLLKTIHHPLFVRDCSKALALAKNLITFTCTVHNLLPPLLLPLLAGKESMEAMRINANLTSSQSDLVCKLEGLNELCLDFASWNLLDRLPAWIERVKQSLVTLSLTSCNDLNTTILDSVLHHIPNIRALYCTGSPRIDHTTLLLLIPLMPSLESLAFSITDNAKSLDTLEPATVQHLRCLAVDLRCFETTVTVFTALKSVLKHLRSAPLVSFAIKIPDRQNKLSHVAVTDFLLKWFAHTLKRVAAIDCIVDLDTISAISHACINLERLELSVPTKDMELFVTYLSCNQNVHTLIDLEGHNTHGERTPLAAPAVRWLFAASKNLKTIVSDARVWTRNEKNPHDLVFEPKPSLAGGTQWFIPPTSYFRSRQP